MTGKTHIALGTTIALYTSSILGATETLFLLGGTIIGSLLPDIDHPKAMINQKILPIKNKLVLMIFLTALGIFILTGGFGKPNILMKTISIFIILAGVSIHRTFTHSLVGLGFIVYISYLFYKYSGMYSFAIGLSLGAVVHVLGDICTNAGTTLFYPFSNQRIKIPVLTTGGMMENMLFVILVGFSVGKYI